MNIKLISHIKLEMHILTKLYNLKNLVRYNPRTKIANESVAEHSFFVALFTAMIAEKLEMSDSEKLRCITKALIHDLPEIDISDIPHNVKRKYPEIKEVVERAENEWFKKFMPSFENLCTTEEEDDIVEIADIYSVVQYCENERRLGNQNFEDIAENSLNRIATILSKYCTRNREENLNAK